MKKLAKNYRILCFLEELDIKKIGTLLTVSRTVQALWNYILYNKTSLITLFNAEFQIALLNQLTWSKICLLMHFIWVRINGPKSCFRNQESIWLVKTFELLDLNLLDYILHNEECGLFMGKRI